MTTTTKSTTKSTTTHNHLGYKIISGRCRICGSEISPDKGFQICSACELVERAKWSDHERAQEERTHG